MEEKCSNAFTKHVDPIFVIQNNLLSYTHRTGKDSIMQMSLESKADEELLIGICKHLSVKIENKLRFNATKKRYQEEILDICKHDLSYEKYKSKKQSAYKKLFNHAKLKYCIDNYFGDNNFGNETYMAGLLISMYANICNTLKARNLDEKIPSVRRSKLYNYVKDVNLEQGIDISKYSQFSFSQFAEIIFNYMVDCQFEVENSIIQPMLVTEYDDDKNRIGVKEEFASIFVLDDNSSDYKKFKKEIEQEVYDWLIQEMHTLDNGMIF